MSFQHTIIYDNAANFSLDAEAAVDTSAHCASFNLAAPFTQNFTSSTGFTYDNTKVEFTGTLARQIDQRPANATFGATYSTTLNGDWGNGTLACIINGGTTLSGGKLDMTRANITNALKIPKLSNLTPSVFTIKFKFTPYYSGYPSSTSFAFFSAGESTNNYMKLYHYTAGQIYFTINNSSGTPITSGSFGSWVPVSGTTYEFELNVDCSAGTYRLFIDGVQKGSSLTGTGTRTSTGTYLVIGNDFKTYTENHPCTFDDIVLFSSTKHSSDYTPGYTLPTYSYYGSVITMPEMHNTYPGTISSFASLSSTYSGAPRITLQIGRSGNYLYYDGSGWVISNGTYAQANTMVDFANNVASLPVNGQVYGQYRVFFTDSNVISSITSMTSNMTIEQYSLINPTVTELTEFLCDSITSVTESSTVTGSDLIKYILEKDSIGYYWDGTAWSTSNGTYTQANTITEINTNISAWDLSLGASISLKAFLHSEDGLTTPYLLSNVISYSFFGGSATTIPTCFVWGYTRDAQGAIESGVIITATLKKSAELLGSVILKGEVTTTSLTNGYWELEFPQTLHYDFSFSSLTAVLYKESNLKIPAATSKNFDDLTTT